MTDHPVMVRDRWPPGKLRPSAKAAYDVLARSGDIVPQGVLKYKSGVVVVEYAAQLPEEWVHDLLRKVEKKIPVR